MRRAALAVAAAVLACAGEARADLDPRVLVLPVEGAAAGELGDLPAEIGDVMARGAARTTPHVARATASLDDTAVIVGCDPATPACLDAVAAALNVDQLLIAEVAAADGGGATVALTAVTRETVPVRRTFPVRPASRKQDLAAIEAGVPEMLEAGEARRLGGGDRGGDDGGGDGGGDGRGDGRGSGGGVGEGRGSGGGVGDGGGARGGGRLGPTLVVGAGGALVAVGAVFWGLAASAQGDIDDAPTGTPAELDRLAALEDRAATRATVGNVLVVGGALAVAAGVTWYVIGRRGDERATVVAPTAVPGGAGVALGGRW